MLGTKLYKGQYTNKEYADLAIWCNANNATIVEKGECYEVEEIVPTKAELQQYLKQAIQSYMDLKVQERDYADIVAACSYSSSTDHIFAAEGIACVKWRDAVWRKYFDVMADVDEGTREFPTAEEMIAELPVLKW